MSGFMQQSFRGVMIQSVLALRRFVLRNSAHTNFYNKAYNLRLARLPNANSLIRNLPNKIEHLITKIQEKNQEKRR
jgi:hypothetical protein